MQPRVLGLVDDTHPATAEFLNDAVVRNGLADHAQACYGGSVGKSMKAGELASRKKLSEGESRLETKVSDPGACIRPDNEAISAANRISDIQ